MRNRWSEVEAARFREEYGPKWGEDLALQAYCSRLLGEEKEFALPGGASVSVKGLRKNIFGESSPAMWIVQAGSKPPARLIAVDLAYLRRLRDLKELADRELIGELRTHVFDSGAATPLQETLAHAFLSPKYLVHARSGAVLALADQENGGQFVREALGGSVIFLPYCGSAFEAAKAAAEACEAQPDALAVIWANHGILTWGETARAVFSSLTEIVTRAEVYLDRQPRSVAYVLPTAPEIDALVRKSAPIVRGLLARRMTDSGHILGRVILRPLASAQVNGLLVSENGKKLALMPPLACDNAAITKPLPMWVDSPDYDDPAHLRQQVSQGIEEFERGYKGYCSRNAEACAGQTTRFDSAPRVIIMPGLGAFCAGPDVAASAAVRDAAEATLAPRSRLACTAVWQALPESELFRREYGAFVRAKAEPAPLAGRIALVTGAAGAIGAGISEGLLRSGCAVAVADLPGEGLGAVFQEFREKYGELVMELPFDVAEPAEVADAFGSVILKWGGLDLVVATAGVAHVSSLSEMRLEAFRKLERVNIEGTLNILSECARHFALQACGGDVVLISTKNVFAPGAKFGAYSATKAAAHQLARIASLEFAELDVRVNMVAPDAVFRHGARPSGLWGEVGADRARSLGMTADHLEAYYRNRCLLKAEVTAEHVANAVLYFATHQTPTTGATLPVDGGLPAATPR
jgi:rhamnose utilization protein RhaD (predicted bifunctional aldolase and dehydrogenase)/NADP-dependent 3-hydroxy acid dehydrogenase YdfG